MEIAHIIMAYKNPTQLERMIKAMDHPSFYFYIHVDKKIDIKPFEYLADLERVTFIRNRKLCNWGGYSFVKAIFASVGEILDSGVHFDFYNLMSAQDYPIRPVSEIAGFYEKNLGKCFISYDTDPLKLWWSHAVTRYQHFHFTDFNFKGKYLLQGIMYKIFPKRVFPLPYDLYGSSTSSWWSITPECARYLIDHRKQHPELERFMNYTWGADEFLIATIVMNSPFSENVVNDNLRYITWNEGSANPRILIGSDIDAIISSGKFFARKFDVFVDETILDELDQRILQIGNS